ncbi:mitochondrial inner-membrane-bound regulator-domain-containing protein [Achaetomium macrosporum]|uniref:Mitochondrial inner-membrane-bound regulator-domain-containing protein n=1 Tax=Achaetomium macrosporum TaxID=79813 RepID=A0AAN7CH90_9PEZI|nr:mitochondrial inner-membrane-bound regulator-domain-containing protein [Achaetomium macrosporum]
MLGRRLTASASFVCLTCRLQLAGSPKRLPFPAVAVPPARATRRYIRSQADPFAQLDEASRQADGEQSKLEPNPAFSAEPDGEAEGYHEGNTPYLPLPPPPPPPNRTYKSRGHLLAPEREGLSVDILGKPGSAIVLREKQALKKKRRSQLSSENSTDAPVDPESLLSSEGADTAPEDVLLNIHELKPKDTRILSDRQFRKLKRTLIDGFTNAQLGQYMREYQRLRQFEQEEGEHSSEELPWVLGRQPWVPLIEDAQEDVEPHLEGYITNGMAPKERLAVRLMRECWDISNQKVIDRDGHVSVTLSDVEFSLLTFGNRRWLEGTRREVLARVKQVKLIRESRLLSIVAPKPVAETILDRANDVLTKARTSDFAVDLVSSEPLKPGVLEEVGRITNTVTRLDPSGKKVLVTWIHMSERSEDLENAAETVLRFLRDAYGPKPRASSTLQVPRDLADRGRYLPVLNGYAQKLPWQERSERWERWTVALPHLTHWDTNVNMQPAIPADILPYAIGTENVIKQQRNQVDTPPGWSSELQTDTSAIFGQVVFARQKQLSSGTPLSLSEPPSQLDTSLSRTFIPALPALGSLNLPTNLKEEGLWHTISVIRFAPSPEISPELIASAPNLELRIEADHREIIRLVSLRAITDAFTGDVLFPAAAVDARLVQQRYFVLPGASIEHHVPTLLTFISKSKLLPWDGKLSTPPVLLGVRLPRRLFSPTNTTTNANDGTSSPSSEEDNTVNDIVEVNYSLSSIEVQRTVTAEYEGLKLRYTSIQGGQRGGERSELSLEAVRVEPPEEAEAVSKLAKPEPDIEDLDRYEIVDEDEEKMRREVSRYSEFSEFRSHVANQGGNGDSSSWSGREIKTKPAELTEFLHVASGIINETGGLKWHAKRS